MTTDVKRAVEFLSARREVGLSDETMMVLLHLHISSGGTKDAIAAGTEINPTTLPRYLSRLVASGHLEKHRGAADAREVVFRLSEHGRRLVGVLLKSFSSDGPSSP